MDLVYNGRLTEPVIVSTPARAAVAGNPSDLAMSRGIGAVLSIPIPGLKASVILMPSDRVSICDPEMTAPTWNGFVEMIKEQGIGNWENISHTAILVFDEMILSVGVRHLPVSFSVHFDTTIPRQRGAAGSSAMIRSFLLALLKVHGLEDHEDFVPSKLAKWVLKVEEHLGVAAGLQDRLLQCYADMCDALYMDFSEEAFARNGGECGEYKPLHCVGMMPMMALLLSNQPSYSGAAHAGVKAKIEAGDSEVLRQMKELAEYALRAKMAFVAGDWKELGHLMSLNATGRVEIYGADHLGPVNMAMRDVCEKAFCPANYTGSGGAMITLLLDGEESLARLRREARRYCGTADFEILPLR